MACRHALAPYGAESEHCVRLQDLDWGLITLHVVRNLIAPGGFSARSTFLAPTLRQARAACMEAFGVRCDPREGVVRIRS
eukprot:4013284-Heterocapsa_arctica.AAC.1